MKSVIGLKDEDKVELAVYVEAIERHETAQNEQVARFSRAKASVELLAAAWKRLAALHLDQMDPAVMRNAEMMTHFMNECRESDKEAALHANVVQAMKEALTLLLAERYEIDIKNEWHLDLERGFLSYDHSVQPPQD